MVGMGPWEVGPRRCGVVRASNVLYDNKIVESEDRILKQNFAIYKWEMGRRKGLSSKRSLLWLGWGRGRLVEGVAQADTNRTNVLYGNEIANQKREEKKQNFVESTREKRQERGYKANTSVSAGTGPWAVGKRHCTPVRKHEGIVLCGNRIVESQNQHRKQNFAHKHRKLGRKRGYEAKCE